MRDRIIAILILLTASVAHARLQNAPDEQLSKAKAYEEGTGVPKDLKLAIDLYRKAAEAGYPEAQVRLGKMLGSGEATKPDVKTACFWTRLAALGSEKYRDSADEVDARLHCKADDTARRIVEWLESHEERFEVPGFVWLSRDESKKYELQSVRPRYPDSAKQSRLQGTVIYRALVNSDGTIRELALLFGNEPFLSPTLSAIQTWRFKPYLVQGNAVPFVTTIKTEFTLR